MTAIVAKAAEIDENLVFFIILTKNEAELRNLSFLMDYTGVFKYAEREF